MDQQPEFENPYASPAPPDPVAEPFESADRAVWGDNCVTFAFQPSVEDYVAAQQFLNRQRSTTGGKTRPVYSFWVIVVAVLVALFMVVAKSSPAMGRVANWLTIGFFGLLAAAILFVVFLLVIGRLSGGLAKLVSSDPEEWLCRKQVTIGPDGLITTTSGVDVLRRWHSVEEAAETDKYIFVVRKTLVLVAIPKRIFTGSDEAARVVRLVQSFLRPAGS